MMWTCIPVNLHETWTSVLLWYGICLLCSHSYLSKCNVCSMPLYTGCKLIFSLYRNIQLIVCLESQKVSNIFVGKSVEPRASWILVDHSVIELHPHTVLCLQLWNLDFGRILGLLGLCLIFKLNWINFYIMRWAVRPGIEYYNLNIKCFSQTYVFKHIVLSWWHCFRMLLNILDMGQEDAGCKRKSVLGL